MGTIPTYRFSQIHLVIVNHSNSNDKFDGEYNGVAKVCQNYITLSNNVDAGDEYIQ
jgi:hypothetical protein